MAVGCEDQWRRVMIEIENHHRSVPAIRAQKYAFLTTSDYHRAFISIRIFHYRHTRRWCRSCCVEQSPHWRPAFVGTGLVAPVGPVGVGFSPYVVPTPPGPPLHYFVGGAAPPIVVHAAFDCVNLHWKSRDSYTRPGVAGELPAVSAFPPWLGVLDPADGPSPPSWLFHIPHYDVVYKVRDIAGNLVAFPLPVHNFVLELASVVRAARVAVN